MSKNNVKFLSILVLILVSILAINYLIKNKELNTIEHPDTDKSVSLSIDANKQNNTDKEIIEDLEKNKYALDNASVIKDPYYNSVLSALIVFKIEGESKATVTVHGKYNNDLVLNYDVKDNVILPIYGLYPNYNNMVTVKLSNGMSKDFYIYTPDVYIDNATVYKNSSLTNDDYYLMTSPVYQCSYIIDKYGDIRWFAKNFYHDAVVLENNHILLGGNDFVTNSSVTDIYEMDFVGRIYKKYEIYDGYSNTFIRKNDGNILAASRKSDRITYSDYIVEIDKDTGSIVKSFDVYEILKKIDPDFVSKFDENYLFNSGIFYNESEDLLLLSYWGGEFVMAVNYSNGNLRWILANPKNFSSKFDSYLLKLDDPSKYPLSVHSAYMSGDELKVFDNGYDYNNKDLKTSDLNGARSILRTYKISGKSIKEVSSFGKYLNLFSYALADYNHLSNNNELILFGRELEDFDFNDNININDYYKLSSRIFELVDGNTVFDAKMTIPSLTIDKINLNKSNYELSSNLELYSSISADEKQKITSEIIRLIKASEKTLHYRIGFSNNVLVIDRYYMDDEDAKVVLINDSNKGGIYTYKESGKEAVSKIKVDLPKGKYYVYIYENGTMYKTNSYVNVN